jgi:hypothetical protein
MNDVNDSNFSDVHPKDEKITNYVIMMILL